MQIRGQRTRSPRDMFLFSMVQDGPHGIQHLVPQPAEEHLADEEIANYGVDWEAAEDPAIMRHLLDANLHELEDENPFIGGVPAWMNHVPCDAPDAPLPAPYIALLDENLQLRVNTKSDDMGTRRLVWQEALNICIHLRSLMNA